MDVKAYCVPPDSVEKVWGKVCHFIYEAMQRGNLGSYRAVADMVFDGRGLLWLVWDGKRVHAAVVTTLVASEWRKVCEIVACGGTGRVRWLHLIGILEDYARAEGCAAVRVIGRKGWLRALKDYRAKRVILEKEIT